MIWALKPGISSLFVFLTCVFNLVMSAVMVGIPFILANSCCKVVHLSMSSAAGISGVSPLVGLFLSGFPILLLVNDHGVFNMAANIQCSVTNV